MNFPFCREVLKAQEKAKSQVLISIVLISVLYLIPPGVAPVHADSVGKVCISANGNTSCPATPPLLNSTNALPIHQVRVAVVIDGSEGLTGFDVILQTDHTILRPASVDLGGTVLHGTPVILAECLSGQLKAGSACSPKDTVDTIELAATSSVGSSPTNPPTTGLLFTATYNVTGNSSNILIGFQTGCSLTSTTGTCVTIAGLSGNDPETVQSAKFTDQNYFDIQGYSLNNPNGPVGLLTDPQRTTDTSLGINVTSINNFNGKVALAVTWPSSLVNFSATVSPIIVWVNNTVPSSVFIPNPPVVTLRIGANAPPGTYPLNFTGTSGNLPPNILSITLTIPAPDFVIIAAPTFLKFNVSSSGAAMISLLGIANFSGTVGLTLSRLAGLNASLSDSHLIITNGNSVGTTLTVNSTRAGIYELNVTGTFGQMTHTTTVGVQVLDFTIAARDPVVVLSKGATGSEELFVGSAFYAPYNVTVTIAQVAVEQIFPNGTSSSSSGISVECTPGVLTLTSFGFPDALVTSNCQIQAIADGNYVVMIVGSAGRVTHFATFSVEVGANFVMTTNNLGITVERGSNANSTLTLSALSGFNGTVALTESVSPGGLSVELLPNRVVLSSASFVTIKISASSAPTGPYNITVVGTSGSIVHSLTLRVVVVVPPPPPPPPQIPKPFFGIAASPPSLNIVQGNSNASMITFTSFYNFTGTLSLTTSTVPPGLETSLAQSSVVLTSGGRSSVSLTVIVGGTMTAGVYSTTLTAKSGTVSEILMIPIAVIGALPLSTATVYISPGNITDLTHSLSTVTFAVNIASAPSIAGFVVYIAYNAPSNNAVLTSPSIDYIGNVLGTSTSVVNGCIDSVGTAGGSCSGLDTTGETPGIAVLSLGLVESGNFSTPTVTNGLLFHVTFHTNGGVLGIEQIHVLEALYAPAGTSDSIDATTHDGYYTNVACPGGSQTPCEPPLVTVTVTPPDPLLGTGSTFSATVVERNLNAFVEYAVWDWGDGTLFGNQTNLAQPIQHVFDQTTFGAANCVFQGKCLVELTVHDSEGINWETTIVVPILSPYLQNGDFALHTNTFPIQLPPTGTTTYVTFAPVGFFSGQLEVGTAVFPEGLRASLSNSFVTIGPGSGYVYLNIEGSTRPGRYAVIVGATNGTIVHTITIQVIVPGPPVANFTFTPTSPIVGQQVAFDGSISSDPSGVVVQWSWNFGDSSGLLVSQQPITYHNFFAPGNYTVTLTVEDNAGLTGSTSIVVRVQPVPQHDVGIVQVNTFPSLVAVTENVGISIQILNNGLDNETVSITAYGNGRIIQTVNGVFLQACRTRTFPYPCYYPTYEEIFWNTTGAVPGNYTISVSVTLVKGEVDPTPADNNFTDGIVTVLPAPVITLNPTSGSIGTKIQVQAAGFVPQYQFSNPSSEPIWVSFDNNFLGEAFAHNGSFTFTFDVIEAQPGPHLVMAQDLYTGARATAPFTVTASPSGSLSITVNTGTVYFPGDTVVVYVLTTINGSPPGPGSGQLHLFLFGPSGSNLSLAATRLGPGVYRATYSVPRTGPLGTYLLLARASGPGNSNASAITTFEVKLSWLSSNGGNVAGAAAAVGLVGLAAVGWKKGYFKRKRDGETPQLF